MEDESGPAKLPLAEVICQEDGVDKGISNEALAGTNPAVGVQCERVTEPDADQSLQMSHQNFVTESYSMMESVDQSKKTTDIEKPKRTKSTEKKGSNGAGGTLTTTSEDPQEVNENPCLKGIAFFILFNYPS